jgi:hypothetical protein
MEECHSDVTPALHDRNLHIRISELEKPLRKIKNWYATHRKDSFLPTSIIEEVNEVIE